MSTPEVLDECAIDDPVLLAQRHTPRAIARLADLMECGGRQAQTAVIACKTMLEIAMHDDARIKTLVEEKLRALLVEAERRRAQPVLTDR